LTVAHELGHNLGAPHDFSDSTTGHIGSGIMSYDGNSNEFSQTSQTSLCNTFQCNTFWTNFDSIFVLFLQPKF
jgi:hypothetical protein